MKGLSSLIISFCLFAFLAEASLAISPFFSSVDAWDEEIAANGTSHELVKRQSNACPNSYTACTNLGAPGLCCGRSQICSADRNGYVACCPTGALCTGTITGIVTGGTILAGGALATSSTNSASPTSAIVSTTITTSQGLVLASVTSTASSTQGFIVAASTTVATLGSSGVRSLHVPLYARLIIRALEYIPM